MKKEIKPPRLASKLFEWYCDNALVEDLYGDMEELFYFNLQTMSPAKAKRIFWQQVVSLLFSYALKKRKRASAFHPHSYSIIHPVMIKNYFKMAWRMISKNVAYSLINVLGLAFGICACLLIYLVTKHEFSFDTFHPDHENIYRVVMEEEMDGNKISGTAASFPLANAIREEIVGVETVTGFHHYSPKISIPDKDQQPKQYDRNFSNVIVADPEYFKIFQYTWLAGNAAVLNEPFTVVLSESKARGYFGSDSWDNIIGREIVYDDSLTTTVKGIVKDWTGNTDFPMTDFISLATVKSSFLRNSIQLDNWKLIQHSSKAFVKLKPGTSRNLVNSSLTTLIRKRANIDGWKVELKLQSLSDIHFNIDYVENPGMLSTLYTLMALAFFILLIAAINFINLSTAQSIRRAKEVGIRKVLGSLRGGLISQFLVQTFLLTLFSVTIAVLMINVVLSAFESFIPWGVHFDFFNINTLIFLLLITIFTSLLAGFYPGKVLSSYLPIISLKGSGSHRGKSGYLLRKGLIVFQFTFSLFFIIGTLVIGKQIRFIQTKDRGFSTESVITVRTNSHDQSGKTKILAERIKQINGVTNTALQFFPPMGFAQMINIFEYRDNAIITTPVSIKAGNIDFIPMYQIRLLAGRNFIESDSLKEVVINRTYAKTLGFKNLDETIGRVIYKDNKPHTIVGVMEDFHERDFHIAIGPGLIGYFPELLHGVAIKIDSKDKRESDLKVLVTQIEKQYKQLYPDEIFDYHFIEDEIGWMHDKEKRIAKLMNIAMIVTIFISCMGIFGLSMFAAEVRKKEIGIRKVLGATITNIASMLSKEFVLLIAIAIIIASPIAWYFMNNWLLEFTYRINLGAEIFLMAAIATIFLGLATISFHAIRAAVANPVASMREE